ncbi:hypothetical protein VTN77DRAFT_3242 [Rasamsonia byssochlamydoides]|uniref:uncharacterized protein n=1 Tax=Rasamsonia byssochlamydoides TaxID=89139 RepID=UPI0037422C16
MSFFSQQSRRRRTLLGYWVPLALTVGIATISIAAWIWSERNDDEDADDGRDHPEGDLPPGSRDIPPGEAGAEYARTTATETRQDDGSVIARMQGALRRTPSPQQIFDGASRRVVAGMAAAGALVGGALSSIREEGRGDFEDHSRWSEEADSRARNAPQTGVLPPRGAADKRKKTVAVVVSSVSLHDDSDDLAASEHASMLSHMPQHVDPDVARVFVLIYAPDLKHSIAPRPPARTAPSVASSFSNIGHEEVASPSEVPSTDMTTLEPRPADDLEATSPLFKTLYSQAQTIVDKETMIMPFSTANGHVHILRHLSPDIVYIQESLAGQEGEAVQQISGWVRQIVVVVGDEGGRGGLIDSEDESALADQGEKWWQREGVTGIGKRIDVVDGLRTGDDWRRRVSGHD